MKKILILGGTGFIGINLTLYFLKNSEYEITIFGRNLNNYPLDLQEDSRIKVIKGEFGSKCDFDSLVKGKDIIFHLISTTVPTTSNKNIAKEIAENIESTSILLEACVKYKVKKIVFLSSGGTVYGITDNKKISEDMQTNPITSYGLQKLSIEKLLYLYSYIGELDYRIIRLANPYGPYQKVNGSQGVIATFIYNMLCNKELLVYGDGSIIRDYLYVNDAICAIINIFRDDAKEKIYNVGSGMGLNINEIIVKIQQILGIEVNVRYIENRKVDVPVNILDISRYEKEFGKVNLTSFQDGVLKTAAFIKQHILAK